MSTLVLVGAQWGDEGKGKVVDCLSEHADVVVRYQGGANAGHTVVVEGREYKLHLLPSGLLTNKVCIIGNGVAIDPSQLLTEMNQLIEQGIDISRVSISDCAHVIMPYHKLLDSLEEKKRGKNRLGTTGRGIGPAYQDKFARVGIRMSDLMDEHVFRERLGINLAQVNALLEQMFDIPPLDFDEVFQTYITYANQLRTYVTDTSVLINEAIDQGKRVLFEGAQGTLLDIDHGTYPYVTSSHPTAGGACIGSGVGPTRIRRVVGVTKAYSTRVGDGPFPTEETGEAGEWLRSQGREFGTTTGRPRRCGWLDLVALRYAVRINGLTGLAVTKLDTLTGLDTIRVGIAYETSGQTLKEWPRSGDTLSQCRPRYVDLPGWKEDISNCRKLEELPAAARSYLNFISEQVNLPLDLVSVGPDRQQTIFVGKVF